MYDILFIDDKFKEIKETFSCLQDKHIRCFYSDGDKYLPQSGHAKELCAGVIMRLQ
jgi:DnaJ-class molecular chaperone